jgi:hypothetical protein
MSHIEHERRKYPRYDTGLNVSFYKKYDVKIRVKFVIIASILRSILAHRHFGLTKNVSAEGICFFSHNKLDEGDLLALNIYPPNIKNPVKMEGQVVWSREVPEENRGKIMYLTGIRVLTVDGQSVADSIHFDEEYKVIWSAVLDSLFHNFEGIEKAKGK